MLQKLSEHVVKNTSVLEIGHFDVGIKSALHNDGLAFSGLHFNILSNSQVALVQHNIEGFLSGQAKSFSILSVLVLEWQDSHTDQVASVDSLEALGNDSLDSLQVRTLGSPISGRTGSVFLAGKNNGLVAFLHVLVSGIENVHLLAGWEVDGLWAWLLDESVDDSDIGESTSCHNLIISSSSTISVEVFWLDSSGDQVSASWGVLGDVTGGGDVISGDGVSETGQAESARNVLDVWEFQVHVLEEWWVVDISRVRLPVVLDSLGSLEVVPSLSSLGNDVIDFLEHLRLDGLSNELLDLVSGWPDVSQEDWLSVFSGSDWLGFEVNVDGSGKSVGNNERWGTEVVGSGEWVDSSFEVSVTRKNGSGDQVSLGDSLTDCWVKISRVTNAGHASVSGKSEAQFVEIFGKASLLIVSSDDSGSWGKGGLDVWLGLEALAQGVLGEDTSSDHDIRVGSVGAGSDGGDDDGTVSELIFLSLVVEGNFGGGLVLSNAVSLEADLVGQAVGPVLLHVDEGDSVVGSLGAGEAAVDGAEVEFQELATEDWVLLRAIIDSE